MYSFTPFTLHSLTFLLINSPTRLHLQSSVLFLLFASLLFLLPPLPLFIHLFLDFFQPLTLFLLLLLLLHWGEQLLWASHQPLVLCVDLFPGHRHCGLGGQEVESEWQIMVAKWGKTFTPYPTVQFILSLGPQWSSKLWTLLVQGVYK